MSDLSDFVFQPAHAGARLGRYIRQRLCRFIEHIEARRNGETQETCFGPIGPTARQRLVRHAGVGGGLVENSANAIKPKAKTAQYSARASAAL